MYLLKTLLALSLLAACGKQPTSHISGLPSEGDIVIADLRNGFQSAQVIDRPALLSLVLERNYSCEMHDARSYLEANAGANNRRYQMRIYRSDAGSHEVRYDWIDSTGPAYSFADAGIDRFGFGVNGVASSGCAGSPIANMIRLDYMNRLLIEQVWLEACPNTPNHSRLRPASRPGYSVLAYGVCAET